MTTDWTKPPLKYASVAWQDVAEGDELPALARTVDPTLVVLGAVSASHDFYPVHHDKDAAQAAGAPDVFLNILTTNGLMASYVTNWCGPDWDLAAISLRLLVPAFPGQKLTTTATIDRKYEPEGHKMLDITFAADTDYGPHCKGTATIKRD